MVGTIVARAHRPISTAGGIPAHGQFDEATAAGSMYIGAGVGARSDGKVNPPLDQIAASDFGPLQVHAPRLLNGTVDPPGGLMHKSCERRHAGRGTERS